MSRELEEMLLGGGSSGDSQAEGFSITPDAGVGGTERVDPAATGFRCGSVRPGERHLQAPTRTGSGFGPGAGSASACARASKVRPIIPPNTRGLRSSSTTAFFRIAPVAPATTTTTSRHQASSKNHPTATPSAAPWPRDKIRFQHDLPPGVTAVFPHDRHVSRPTRRPTTTTIYKATFWSGERFPTGPTFLPIGVGSEATNDVFNIDNLSVDEDEGGDERRNKGNKGKGRGRVKDYPSVHGHQSPTTSRNGGTGVVPRSRLPPRLATHRAHSAASGRGIGGDAGGGIWRGAGVSPSTSTHSGDDNNTGGDLIHNATTSGRVTGGDIWSGAGIYPSTSMLGLNSSSSDRMVSGGGRKAETEHELAGLNTTTSSPSACCSSNGMFSDDQTERDLAFESDGNMFCSDGGMGSVIGSIDGENKSATTDSSYLPSSTQTSTGSSSLGEAFAASDSVVYYAHGIGRAAVDLERPMGMMIAIGIPGGGGFMCGKVSQSYDGGTCEVEGTETIEKGKVFEVVFKDGSKAEYDSAEIMGYRNNYLDNRGEMGCKEFMIMI